MQMAVWPITNNISGFSNQLHHKIVILCPSGLQIFTQGYPAFESGGPNDYRQIITSFQRWKSM